MTEENNVSGSLGLSKDEKFKNDVDQIIDFLKGKSLDEINRIYIVAKMRILERSTLLQ